MYLIKYEMILEINEINKILLLLNQINEQENKFDVIHLKKKKVR